MKRLFYLIVVLLFIVSCSPPEENETQRHLPTGPFIGSHDLGENLEGEISPNNVNIVYSVNDILDCEEVRFIQVVQIIADGTPMLPSDYSAIFGNHDRISLEDDMTTSENEKGTHVDTDGRFSPFSGSIGLPDFDIDPSLDDTPQTQGGNNGFGENGWSTVKYEFEACLFCTKGESCPTFYGCMLWEFEKTADDQSNGEQGRSTFIGQTSSPSPKFISAYNKYKQEVPSFVECS